MSLAFTLGLAGASLAATGSETLKGHELTGKARVSLAEARAIAVKARPGSITDQELEKEGGGSGLRYSFDIASDGKTYEVGVDAKTGKVLENGRESAGAEAAEAGHGPH
jgi:uncharacterized membrane protein YkoI